MSESTVTSAFDPHSWDMVGSLELSRQLVSGDVLAELADERDDICVLTADLGRPTRVISFQDHHPSRYFNFGIAERGMVTAAAGMAACGMVPYVSGYAAFLALIATEQLRTDVCYPGLPVRILGTHSGLAMGFYGTSHHATEDIGILRSLPGLTVLAPVDAVSLRQAIESTVDEPGPVYFRLGRGRETPVYEQPLEDWHIGGSAERRAGSDVAILATGICVASALEAADVLAAEGVAARVVDCYSLKPLDDAAVLRAARETGRIVTAEEHGRVGGLGSAVADALADGGIACRLSRVSLPDQYSVLGPPTHLYRHYGIDATGIARACRAAMES